MKPCCDSQQGPKLKLVIIMNKETKLIELLSELSRVLFQICPEFSKERLVHNICSRKDFVNDVCVTAFTETASKKAYLLCPKPCFRRRNWYTNEDGVRVPKEAISEERLTFLCRRPDVDEPNCDVLFSYEEAITYVHPRSSQTVRGLHKMPKRKTLVQDRGKFAYHFSYILVVSS